MSPPNESVDPSVIQEILRNLTGLRFGSVEIIVHEGKVTQIERREKVRFNAVATGR